MALVEENAAMVDALDAATAQTPLLDAASNGQVEVARYLLDHGARIYYRVTLQITPLQSACKKGHAEFALFLLQRGANINATDEWGKTPVMCAANDAIVRMLLEHGGCDIDAVDCHGRMACDLACLEGRVCALRQLLEAGADPTVCDASLRDAATQGHQHCLQVVQGWHRAYTLHRARSVRDASLVIANSGAPVDAAPSYFMDRATSGLTMPTVHVRTHQQHGQPSDNVREEGHIELNPVALGGMVTVYAIEELTGEVFVELMELMGI